jgi:hypothetical protein
MMIPDWQIVELSAYALSSDPTVVTPESLLKLNTFRRFLAQLEYVLEAEGFTVLLVSIA